MEEENEYESDVLPCTACGGTGVVDGEECVVCSGTGVED